MSEHIHKSHNVSKLMYHFVFPTKYRRVVVSEEVDEVIKETCEEISKRYDLYFLEIGTDKDHVHFLIQSVPSYSPTQIVKKVKSITAKEVFSRCPEVKKKLWGGNFFGCYTFYFLYYQCRTIAWHRLDQKMYMIFIRSYLQKIYVLTLIP